MFEENPLNILLASFFYEHGYLRIPGLGRFDLSGEIYPGAGELHGRHAFPPGSITFNYDPAEEEDPELTDFITSRTRKMRALAVSDLDSLADSAREMLNIRQSYTFTGIATLIPSSRGFDVVPERMPANVYANKAAVPEMFHQGNLNPIIREGKVHSSGGSRSLGGIVITGVCVVIIALLIYFLFFHRAASGNHTFSDREAPDISTLPVKDSVNRQEAAGHRDSLLHYEVIFEHGGRDKAFSRYRQLTGWGHRIIMRTRDSVLFTLAVPVATPAADTAAVKDSIRALYGHPVSIRYISR